MGVKTNLRIIKKNPEADTEKGFSQNRFQSRMDNGHAARVGVNFIKIVLASISR